MAFSSYTSKQASELYSDFSTSEKGLTGHQAAGHLKKYGPNKISVKETTWWQILIRQFKSPFVYLLIFAAGFAFYLGEHIDGGFIAFFVLLSAALGFIQEYNSEKSVEMLKKFLVNKVKVLRNGEPVFVESFEVVPGDICVLEPGDIIAADIRFVKADNLLVDESILTGESIPVAKHFGVLEKRAGEIYEATNMGFSGTSVIQGKALGLIIATGSNTEIGKITALTATSEGVSTFEKGIAKLSKSILWTIVVTLAFIIIINYLVKDAANQTSFADMMLFAIALAVSVIPEALPVVATLSFSKGAVRLAKKNVVVKRLSAVEDLGGIEVLCTDKTGTLTENKLSVSTVLADDKRQTLIYGALASTVIEGQRDRNNSFDLALYDANTSDISKYVRINEIPFDPKRKRNSVLVRIGNEMKLIVRGAPETVMDLCPTMSHDEQEATQIWIDSRGKEGERVIAIAMRTWHGNAFYHTTDEEKLEYIGTVAFSDPIKESAAKAIADAEVLGVRVKILTGDSLDVAVAVARKTGVITTEHQALTGEEFEQLSIEEQVVAVDRAHVFARVSPEQKYKIISLLQKRYEVGFLGDGINDAPALKVAGVALAVDTATDIARSASDIVLLSPSLEVIIDGIRSGREIFGNMVKYLKTTLISNFGNFYAISAAMLVAPFLPMLPVQVLLLNLLTDTPMIAISWDRVDKGELHKPRAYDVKEIIRMSLIFGVINAGFVFIFFEIFAKMGAAVVQTNLFIGSVLVELILIFAIRTKHLFWKGARPAPILLWLSLIPATLAIVLPFTTIGHKVLHFVTPQTSHLGIILGLVAAYFVVIEIFKQIYYRFAKNA